MSQIRSVLEEAKQIGGIQEIYFEGGEPFLFYSLMLEGIRLAREMGFNAGVVSNAYWATCLDDAQLWLRPLMELGISNLSISDDDLHYGDTSENSARYAIDAAEHLGIPVYSLCKVRPEARVYAETAEKKGNPEISGGIKLRGRAVEKFTEGLPTRCREQLNECPYEELEEPKRVHLDAFGNVQICQGISIGNCWKNPLSELIRNYDAQKHPVCGPLVRGGPVRLAREHGLDLKDEYVDECHLCYSARLALLDRFPEYLGPKQVYGF